MTGVGNLAQVDQAQPPPPEILVQYDPRQKSTLISQREAVIGRFSRREIFIVAPCKLFLAEKLGRNSNNASELLFFLFHLHPLCGKPVS